MNEFFPKVIKKRDGKVAPFNIEKIKHAIFRAAYTLGGRDEESLKEADKAGMAMLLSGVRHFRH